MHQDCSHFFGQPVTTDLTPLRAQEASGLATHVGSAYMVSVNNVTVNQVPGVGVERTQWGDWPPNGITETRVLLGRALAPYCQTKQRQ